MKQSKARRVSVSMLDTKRRAKKIYREGCA
nr:MAG TPA: hypothetical protein [Caudoviricetes sp.]